jgi:hypothetical protein
MLLKILFTLLVFCPLYFPTYSHQILVGAKLRALCKFFLNLRIFTVTGTPLFSLVSLSYINALGSALNR